MRDQPRPVLQPKPGRKRAAGYATLDEARQYLKACHDALPTFPQHEEVVIWLDHRLSDQLILIKALDWFSGQNLGAALSRPGSFCRAWRTHFGPIGVSGRHTSAGDRGPISRSSRGMERVHIA